MHDHHPGWRPLLAWLADHGTDLAHHVHSEARAVEFGYGLFALKDLPPSTPLLTIPAAALLNSITLAPHYQKANPQLSSVQIISLHLLLHRPSAGKSSLDPLFGPYISVLPVNFDTHPLAWYWKRRRGADSPGIWLLDQLTPFVKRDLERIANTFQADWERVRSYLRKRPDVLKTATNPNAQRLLSDPESVDDDYLWAWLNVNTRCIYYRIKETKSDPDNLTLCPILDFANHSSVEPSMIPRAFSADIWDMAPSKNAAEEMVLVSPSQKTVRAAEQFYLRYGYHSNEFLFVEYGFSSAISEQGILRGDEHNDIDASPVVEDLFKSQGDLGEWMKERLLEEGYWGGWTLHSAPAPAHPSYRLITALRLYHAFPAGAAKLESTTDSEAILDVWRGVVSGERASISDENEALWRETLLQLCQKIEGEAASRVASLPSLAKSRDDDGTVEAMLPCIISLWNEEKYIARAVLQSIRDDVSF
ncbi:hypothetical protein EST38_g1708 [Candolleomyces aberdarensis]|uniref:Uncharacterized protein n=1 Tax=Candolleomyces aberdarensis TaxID=2316362 RepID=A0A4Q2DYP5_9AGAR|nr:hypothetical protein EST38_g1708 [Candolleomyces aberdarensis]